MTVNGQNITPENMLFTINIPMAEIPGDIVVHLVRKA